MSERMTQDLLRRGLEIVDSYAVWQSDVVGVGHDAEALRAVAALVRRELEALEAGEDVRERVARAGHRQNYDGPDWYDYEVADRILALLRAPHGEGEDCRLAPIVRAILERIDRYQAFHDRVGPADLTLPPVARTITEEEILALRAALRSEAQGEEDVGEVCHLCGEEFDPRESGTVTGPLGQDDGVPRWYRCPRCARAYDAGYQQGQRDPRGDETADPTALRSEAQGEDRWEDLVFGPITEAYNEAHAARRGEGGGNGLE